MPGEQRHEIVLRLRNIEDLFVAPALDPLSGQFHAMSGIEQIMVKSRARTVDGPLHTTITLPRSDISDDLTGRCRDALRGYCADRLQAIDLEKAQLRRQGYKELWLGVIFLAVCLAGSGSIEALDRGPDLLRRFLVEGLVIVGWISLWHPIDLLLFSRWPLIQDQRILQHIRDMDVTIQPTDASAE